MPPSSTCQLKQASHVGDTFSDALPYDAVLNLINGPPTRAILAGFTPGLPSAQHSVVRITSNAVSVLGSLCASSVGIGTLSPQAPLDVHGNTHISGGNLSMTSNSSTTMFINQINSLGVPGWWHLASINVGPGAGNNGGLDLDGRFSGLDICYDIKFTSMTNNYGTPPYVAVSEVTSGAGAVAQGKVLMYLNTSTSQAVLDYYIFSTSASAAAFTFRGNTGSYVTFNPVACYQSTPPPLSPTYQQVYDTSTQSLAAKSAGLFNITGCINTSNLVVANAATMVGPSLFESSVGVVGGDLSIANNSTTTMFINQINSLSVPGWWHLASINVGPGAGNNGGLDIDGRFSSPDTSYSIKFASTTNNYGLPPHSAVSEVTGGTANGKVLMYYNTATSPASVDFYIYSTALAVGAFTLRGNPSNFTFFNAVALYQPAAPTTSATYQAVYDTSIQSVIHKSSSNVLVGGTLTVTGASSLSKLDVVGTTTVTGDTSLLSNTICGTLRQGQALKNRLAVADIDGTWDSRKYGLVQVTQNASGTGGGPNNMAAISLVRNGNMAIGLGYQKGSNILGFGNQTSDKQDFTTNILSMDPSNNSLLVHGNINTSGTFNGNLSGNATYATNAGKASGLTGTPAIHVQNITCNGWLGIGTSSPNCPLHISGFGLPSFTGYGWTGPQDWSNGAQYGKDIGSLSGLGVGAWVEQVVLGGGFISVSDARIKTDVESFSDEAVERIMMSIHPRTFRYLDKISKGSMTHAGFIAQELGTCVDLPSAVNKHQGDTPSVMKLYDYCQDGTDETSIVLTGVGSELTNGFKPLITKLSLRDANLRTVLGTFITVHQGQVTIKLESKLTDPSNKIFLYGEQVADLLAVDHNQIFTVSVAACQMLMTGMRSLRVQVDDQAGKLQNLQDEVKDLRRELMNSIKPTLS